MRFKNELYQLLDELDKWRPGPTCERKFDPAYLYFVTDGSYVKIGVATDVSKRMASLQTGNPKKLLLLMKFRFSYSCSAYSAETYFHNQFHLNHFNGEWFRILKNEWFFHLFFLQKIDDMEEEAIKFMLSKVIKNKYESEDYYEAQRIQYLKYKYLPCYADERNERFEEAKKAIHLLSKRIFTEEAC